MSKKEHITPELLVALWDRLDRDCLEDGDHQSLMSCIELLQGLQKLLDEKGMTISKLNQRLYGPSTEKKAKVGRSSKARKVTADKPPGKRLGRGRLGAGAYGKAEQVTVPHPDLEVGGACPLCPRGCLYGRDPVQEIHVTGGAPLMATCYKLAHLRCSSCQAVFTAPEPESLAAGKYAPSAKTMICLLKYGIGVPLYRLDHFQQWLGVPLPSSTQFDLIESVLDMIMPAYKELCHIAANGSCFHSDDTGVRILSLMEENKQIQQKRKGLHTTGIVALSGAHKILLYTSGRKHSGENMAELLAKRSGDLPPPIHMADALACNFTHSFQVLVGKCLIHGRRQFYDLEAAFPKEVDYVLSKLGKVYANEAVACQRAMTPENRLHHHQRYSAPHLEALLLWLHSMLEEGRSEPNSSLGKAIIYMLRHWEQLTLFLREPGAPLDNSICERALKKFVILRKSSLFYKTPFGALVGDVMLTMIHTTTEAGENPFDYLTALQVNYREVASSPQDWLPWTFRTTLATRQRLTA